MASYSITVCPYRAKKCPNLNAVLRIRHPSGKVERVFFKTIKEAEAEAFAQRAMVENVGLRALKMDHRSLTQAMAAIDALKPFGATLPEAVEYFIDHHKAGQKSVKEMCDAYLDSRAKRGVSTRHMDTLRRLFNRFTVCLGDKAISTLRPEHVETWLHGLGVAPISVNSYRRLLNAVFQYAVDRKLLKENPIAAIELVKEARGKVGILTPGQMQALLTAAQGEPDLVATIAIGGFAGLRPEEVARLKWSAIDLEHGQIDCGAELTKTAKQRYVKIEPVLAAWLKKIWPSSHPNGDIQEANFRRRYDAVRRHAGFAIRGPQLLDDKGEPLSAEKVAAFYKTLAPWPHDALRHSYASYHLAKFEKIDVLALQMGHDNTKMIFKNYRERVKQADAEAWWRIMPEQATAGTETNQMERALVAGEVA